MTKIDLFKPHLLRLCSVLGTMLVIADSKTNVSTPFLRDLLLPPSLSHKMEINYELPDVVGLYEV